MDNNISLGLSSDDSARKARGAFFTPPAVAQFLARWAVRGASDSVLEPSCGEAEFLVAAFTELQRLSGGQLVLSNLQGVEIHEQSCRLARARLQQYGVNPRIHQSDFFDFKSETKFDVVLGNPPYVRYQGFSGVARQRALHAALEQGVRLSGLSSSWAHFVVHACSFLKPSGRVGLVLPAELLSVNYAVEIRQYLLSRFGHVRLVLFKDLVFPEAQEEVVLLLAEGQGPTNHFELYEARGPRDLENSEHQTWTKYCPDNQGKWSQALLPAHDLETFHRLARSDSFETLVSWGAPYLGVVTGNNKYFALSKERASELSLSTADMVRISPPGSRHLRGMSFTNSAWREASNKGARVFLFYPRRRLTKAASNYIAAGQRTDVHHAYKCRSRQPWWQVPMVPIADLFLTYMDRDQPRLVANEAGAAHLNSLYGIKLLQGRLGIGKRLLPIAFLNSLTLLGAELMGRSYGGGILKLEPREADRIPVPSLHLLKQSERDLMGLRPQLARFLRQGDLLKAVAMVDRKLLLKAADVGNRDLQALRVARSMLRERRIARGKSSG